MRDNRDGTLTMIVQAKPGESTVKLGFARIYRGVTKMKAREETRYVRYVDPANGPMRELP